MKDWLKLLASNFASIFKGQIPQPPQLMRQLSLSQKGIDFATWHDINQLEELQRQAYNGYLAWRRKDFQNQWRINPYVLYLVYKVDDQVVGFLHARLNYRAHISNLLVAPSYQNKGIGQKLMNQFFQLLEQTGTVQVTLETRESNLKAKHFYQKFGFKQINSVANYYPDTKESAIVMRWKRV